MEVKSEKAFVAIILGIISLIADIIAIKQFIQDTDLFSFSSFQNELFSFSWIISIVFIVLLSCMSLGFPYIPVDTIYPIERLHKIAAIVNSAIVINTIENKIDFEKQIEKLIKLYENKENIFVLGINCLIWIFLLSSILCSTCTRKNL